MGQLITEINEMKEFINFLERTKRIEKLEYIDKYTSQRTKDCIHVLEDFSATATKNHEKKADHLKRIDKNYKSFREHALDCNRCQHSLDAIFSFTGYENKILFPETIQKILEKEWSYDTDKSVFLAKLPAPGFHYSELTYITSMPLTKAVDEFREKIRIPLDLPEFNGVTYRKKKAGNGTGTIYTQAYLSPKDHRHKTKISIRSRIKG